MSSYSEGQTHQLADALEAKDFTPEHITKLGQYKRLGDIRLVLDGQAEIVMVKKAQKKEVRLDTTIRVDRSVRPAYPEWASIVMDPELENTGPTKYDLANTSLWLHDRQQGGYTTGQVIYDYLKERGMLASCLSLQDAVEIQKKGPSVFRKVFGDKVMYFWKSVVQFSGTRWLGVPHLYVDGVRVMLTWYWLDDDWGDDRPAVRFAS